MHGYFHFGDWLVILLYLGGIIALGVWFGKDQRNTRDYFLGSRNIPWWGIGVSIVAAETSALTIIGVPAIAFSLEKRGYKHLDVAARVARGVIERWVRRPLGTMLLNVNIPSRPFEELQSMKVTRLGRRHHAEPVVRERSPRGDTIWWIGPAGGAREAGPGTDFHAVDSGWVSITPLDVDLTCSRLIPEIEGWVDAR